MTEHAHENGHSHDAEPIEEPKQVGYFPPDSLVIPKLRQELANLNDARFMLTQQVEFQAQIIDSMQAQLTLAMGQLEEAGIEPKTVQPVE